MAKPVSKSKINRLPENKAKRHIYANANAGNSGGPVVDVKAWKAAQQAAAAAAAEDDKADSDKTPDQSRSVKNPELAKACEASAKEALKAAAKAAKKGEIVKGFVGQMAAGSGSDGAKSAVSATQSGKAVAAADTGEPKLAAAAPKNVYAEKTPRMLLQEFCNKQKLNKPVLKSLDQDGGGFKGKFILHSKEKNGETEVRITKDAFPTSDEAQEWAAMMVCARA